MSMSQFPEALKYTKDHEWVSINGDTAIVGITDFAQHELGDTCTWKWIPSAIP